LGQIKIKLYFHLTLISEHNVGHEYVAKPALREFYQKTAPTNSFNSGIGGTSKLKNWQELSHEHKGCGCHK